MQLVAAPTTNRRDVVPRDLLFAHPSDFIQPVLPFLRRRSFLPTYFSLLFHSTLISFALFRRECINCFYPQTHLIPLAQPPALSRGFPRNEYRGWKLHFSISTRSSVKANQTRWITDDASSRRNYRTGSIPFRSNDKKKKKEEEFRRYCKSNASMCPLFVRRQGGSSGEGKREEKCVLFSGFLVEFTAR